ncbi:hypothetical protein INS49_002779 [Diaporthe citri]|uniref:uncharacterized protein n=1 Tax=Diaporthe citri TaxID=83186 RepID=UPI001C80937E|nr:uncharacterized protein INS49_002779 [Diaporthe citri]KAG6368566.1 hypothetical protein INS49_002779 [Diaporthe citri]
MASLINPTAIPSITDLRKELDYGDQQSSRCQAFYDSVRVFRKTFISSQGWDGSSIHDWKSREHQTALGEMVRSYLELHGNGRVFWPDDNSQSRANKYKYSTDGARIKRIMRQLFWRLNIQQHRNIKYKKNKDMADEMKAKGQAKRGRSPSHDLGIDTDVVVDTSASRDACGTPGTPRSSTVINLTDSPVGSHTGVMNPDLRETQSHPTNEREISKDLYRVPDSPDPHILPQPDQPTFAVMSTGIGSDGRQVAPVANMEPLTKGPRGDTTTSTRHMSSKRAGKQPAGPRTSRVSPRKRKLRNMTGRATEEEVSVALQSPGRNPSPEVVVENIAPAETNSAVTSDILPPWTQRPANRFRATVSGVTDEDVSVNGFIHQLNTEPGLDATEPSNSTNHAGPSTKVTRAEAAPQPSIEVESVTRQSSPVSLFTLLADVFPPEGRKVVDERPAENKDAPQAPPVGPARVEFLYRVVCRYPEHQSFSWKPEGSFRSKTLSRLEEELPIHLEWSQFQHLHFRVTAPNARAEHLVCRGREDQFDALKRHLVGFIRDCIADTPCVKTVLVEIDIEPLADVNSVRKSTDREVMDFDW